MNWDDLRIVAAVAQKGTYAKAGLALRMDETTVARRLARIQDALGITLFDAVDGVRRATLYCEAMLEHIEDMKLAASQIGAIGNQAVKPSGNIRITSTVSIAEEVLAPDLGPFLLSHPGLSVEIQTSNDNLNFAQWEADLAIRLGKPAKGAFVVRKIADLKFCLFRPIIDKDGPDPIVCAYPADLGTTPEMMALDSLELPGARRLRTSNVGVIRAVLQSGTGIGILPNYCSADLRSDNRFQVTRLAAEREVWLLIQPHLKNEPATRLVIDWIAESFSRNLSR